MGLLELTETRALGPIGALAVRLQRSTFERDIAANADAMKSAFEAAASSA